jgi:hypothetical protein
MNAANVSMLLDSRSTNDPTKLHAIASTEEHSSDREEIERVTAETSLLEQSPSCGIRKNP